MKQFKQETQRFVFFERNNNKKSLTTYMTDSNIRQPTRYVHLKFNFHLLYLILTLHKCSYNDGFWISSWLFWNYSLYIQPVVQVLEWFWRSIFALCNICIFCSLNFVNINQSQFHNLIPPTYFVDSIRIIGWLLNVQWQMYHAYFVIQFSLVFQRFP